MGWGNKPEHILQPLLERAKSEVHACGQPTRKTLLEIAELLVSCAPNMYSNHAYYGDDERVAAKALLRQYDLDHLANLSPRYKKRTLILIEAEKQILSDDVAAQLEVCH